MKSFISLLVLTTLSAATHAGEAEVACSLEQAKANVVAATLVAPAAIATVGQDAATGEKNVTVGVSQSLVGRSRAETIRESADAKCSAIRSTLMLDEQARWAVSQINHNGAEAELVIIDEALFIAAANLQLLSKQLEVQVITISQYTDAVQIRANLEQRKAELLRVLAIEVLPTPPVSISALIVRAQQQEAQAAQLSAKASADSGWDVVVAGGMRQPISGNKATPFVGVSIKYSFGLEESRASARDVGKYTGQLLAIQQSGYSQVAARQREEVANLIVIERNSQDSNQSTLVQIRKARAPIVGLDTVLAQNVIRALDLQAKGLEAALAGSEARLKGYKALLEKLK